MSLVVWQWWCSHLHEETGTDLQQAAFYITSESSLYWADDAMPILDMTIAQSINNLTLLLFFLLS